MKTTYLGIANYCVPCQAHCRHCLLSSCGQVSGVDFHRSTAFARRVITELKENRPELGSSFYIGYCMDTPDLWEYIRFSGEFDAPGAGFLQMNGFAFRDDPELLALMGRIRAEGVKLIDLTFYGTEEYHDRFAGRKGDYRFMTRMLSAAVQAELPVNISIPLLRSNLDQMRELRALLSAYPGIRFSFFLPHSKGRGRTLQDQRITRREFDTLPEEIRNTFVKIPHQTEAEWIADIGSRSFDERALTLVLDRDNIRRFEAMPAEEILSFLESLDDRYLSQLPSLPELAAKFGDPGNEQLFRIRDLVLKWQQRFIADTGNTIYDMHDESHHFSVHM